jgi:hypothetical protein
MSRIKELIKIAKSAHDGLMLQCEYDDEIANAMRQYAYECCKATLEEAANHLEYNPCGSYYIDNKKSITNPENIVLI